MCDHAGNIQFVEEIKKRPLLYNTSHPQYTRRDLTDAAWEDVGRIVNLPAAACKEKWKNLRTVFVRHVKRSVEEPTEKRRKYYLMDHMEFVLPYMKPTAMLNLTHPNDSEDAWSTTQQNELSHLGLREDSYQQDENVFNPLVSIKTEGKTADDDEGRKSRNTSKPESDVLNLGPDPLSIGISDHHSTNSAGEMEISHHLGHRGTASDVLDVRRMFLLGLLDEVGMMTDAQMRSFKRKVLKLIDEVLES